MKRFVFRVFPVLAVGFLLLSGCATTPAVVTPTTSGAETPSPTTELSFGLVAESVHVDAVVLDAARGYVAERYDWWNHNTGVTNGDGTAGGELASYDDWRIEGLERVWQYKALDGLDIDVYRLDWRLHTTTPDKVLLAGGMDLDDENWHLVTYPGATYLYFDVTASSGPSYLFSLMENDCSPGGEPFTSDLQYELLTVQLRPQVEAQALDYLGSGWDDIRITRLEPDQTFREIADFPVMAWQAEWEVYANGKWNFTSLGIADDELDYLFFRVEGKLCTLLGGEAAGPDGLERAATEAAWGVSDLEFALTPIDPKGWYGIGGPIEGLMDSPGTAEIIDTNGDAIYAEGDYWEETNWDGLSVRCYVTAAEGGAGHISSLTTTLPDLFTCRGVSVGSSRETVELLYPEATNRPNWSFEGDFLSYSPESDGPGYYLVFYFESDTVVRMELINMFN